MAVLSMSGNPILDELDGLSPQAKGTLQRVHSEALATPPPMTGQTMTPPVAPAPASPQPIQQPPTPDPNSAQPMQIAPPKPRVTALTPDADMQAHSGELNRLEGSKSGIAGIKSPWARIPLQIADAVGGAFFPGIEQQLPGTEGHHRLLINEAKATVGSDQNQLNAQQKRGLEAAQTNAQESVPEFRQGTVENNAQKNTNTADHNTAMLAANHEKLVAQTNAKLSKDGYVLDPDTMEERPMKPTEMSDPAQTAMALKRSQKEEQEALSEYHKAQTSAEPIKLQQAEQRLSVARQNSSIASQNASLRGKEYEMHSRGTENGVPLPGALQDNNGQTVGTINAPNVRPTSAERTKGDLAKSVDFQIKTMRDIIARRGDEFFGPGNGRANNLKIAIGNNDPEALKFKAATDFLSEHAAGMFGSRSNPVITSIKDLYSPHFEPKSLLAALDQAQGTSNEFRNAGTIHTVGGPNEIHTGKVKMTAPDGSTTEVNSADVEHYKKLGAKVAQ